MKINVDNDVWRKASRCGSNACVEVAMTDTDVFMRDSKDLNIAPLAFSRETWANFIADLRDGRPQGG